MIPKQTFGRTGHESTRIIFGAAAFSAVSQADADRTMEILDAAGINHIDTAASYGDSEIRLGPWLESKSNRNKVFLATKTGERSAGPAYDQIRRSLDRLRVDQIELIQLHNLVDPTEWETAMGSGGALEAVVRARDEGLVRFIGVTGHGVTVAEMHQRSLERFDFDSVLLPYNYTTMQNPTYAANFEALLALCQERNVAVQTIKSQTKGPWGDKPHHGNTWYEPFTDQADIDAAVAWVLSRPGIFLNTPAEMSLLPKVLDAASRFYAEAPPAPTEAVMAGLEAEPLFV
jgi:aryl-alcohol dehydrogenase-like predicted oxidoreductase